MITLDVVAGVTVAPREVRIGWLRSYIIVLYLSMFSF
jgi:hypothetical protein